LKHIPATIMLPVKLAGYVLTPVLDRAIALRLSVLPATICNLHLFSLPRGAFPLASVHRDGFAL
jgi:hypothetical protein